MSLVSNSAIVALLSVGACAANAATAPVLLKDVNTTVSGGGTAASYNWWPPSFTALGNSQVVFAADDGVHGIELWVTDGTTAGTVLIKDANAGSAGANPSNLCPYNGIILYSGGTSSDGNELWRTDGTTAGTYEIKNIAPQWNSSSPTGLTVVNGKVVFAADDMTHGSELWVTDGTAAGTSLLVDICSGSVASSPNNFVALSSSLVLFTANDGTHGVELWKTDGTAAGTAMVADIASGSTSSSPANFAVVGGYAYFSANDGTHGAELWRSDGTAAGTTLVADICSGATGSSIAQMVAGATRVFFVANDGTHGAELWTCSGTTASLVKDIYSGATGSSISSLYANGDRALFAANDNVHGLELWTSDGTTAGTVFTGDIWTSGSSSPQYIQAFGKTYYCSAANPYPNYEPWMWTPGDSAPSLLAEINPSTSVGSTPRYLSAFTSGLYFFADDGTHGQEPWIVPATPPTVATAAAISPSPVTGTSAAVAVLGDSFLGEPTLTYTWHTTGTPPASVSFSINGTNAAKTSIATFTAAGSYTLACDITDTAARTTTSSVAFTVNQTLTSIVIAPTTASVLSPNTQSFSATGLDQFGTALAQQPSWSWTATGGTIDANGLFTAGAVAGNSYHATASSGSVSGSAAVTVLVNQAPVVSAGSNQTVAIADGATLSGSATDDGLPNNTLTVQWTTVSGPGTASFTNPNQTGTTASFSAAGSYTLRLTASDGALSSSSDVVISVTGPPTVVTAPAATPSPVTSTTTALSILGGSYLGESALTYTWRTTGTPPAAVQFDVNGTNAAKNATATFTAAGAYAIACDITDTANRTTTPSLSLTVNATLTSVTLAPASATVLSPNTQQFSATGKDQFGTALAQQPTWSWTATGGTVDGNGLFTAGNTAGNGFSVTATSGSVGGSATVTVQVNQAPVVSAGANQSVSLPNSATLDGTATDDGLPNNTLTVQWTAINPPAAVTFANANQAATTATFTTAGTYTLRLSATDGALTTTSDTVVTVIAPVTVVQAPTATPTPVTGTTAAVSILGGSIYGESTLMYTWQAGDGAPADVAFTPNGTNAAKSTTATFSAAGNYQLRCTIVDGVGDSTVATFGVSVVQTLTGISVTPIATSLAVSGTTPFAATGLDQFGAVMTMPPTFAWSVSGLTGCSVSSSGLLTAGTATGAATVSAAVGSLAGTATANVVTSAAPTILTGPSFSANPVTTASAVVTTTATCAAGESTLRYFWTAETSPLNGSCTFSPNGTNAAKTATGTFTVAGTYVVQLMVADQQSRTATAWISVTVAQSTGGPIQIKPNPAFAIAGIPTSFTAVASDQFGLPVKTFTWSVTGNGTIGSTTGVYVPSQAGGTATVIASVGSTSGSAAVTVYTSDAASAVISATDLSGDAFPERRSVLYVPSTSAPPSPSVIEPGRVWTGPQAGAGIPALSAPNGTRFTCGRGAGATLTVQAAPSALVTFSSLDGGAFPNQLPAMNVVAGSDGVATVIFTAPNRIGPCRVLVGSGGASGQFVFRGRIQ